MGNSNGKITAPVSLHADIYPVLGLTKSGTFYDTGWVCGNEHGKINPWARNKPMRVDTPAELTETQKHNAAYGLSASFASGMQAQWTYLPPRPGEDDCRLTDFVGYDHRSACGLALKKSEYSQDLFTNKNDLVVELEDSTQLITPYDLRDTIFKGMKLVLSMGNQISQVYRTSIDIDRQSLSFVIPYEQMLLRGEGPYEIAIVGSRDGEQLSVFPEGYGKAVLTLTEDTGIKIYLWSTVNTTIEVLDGDTFYSLQEYRPGVGSRTLNVTGKNFIFRNLTFTNDNNLTLGNSTVYLCFEWPTSDGYALKRVAMYENGTTQWSTTGDISVNRLGGNDSELPKITSSNEASLYTDIYIAYKHTDGRYYRITPKTTIRLKRDNGTSPDLVNPN